MPAETHVGQGPLDRQVILDLVRDRLADILEIEPDTIGEGDSYNWKPFFEDTTALLEPIEPGMAAFDYGNSDVCGVTYSGDTYRTVLLSFSAESINDPWADSLHLLISRTTEFFGGFSVDLTRMDRDLSRI